MFVNLCGSTSISYSRQELGNFVNDVFDSRLLFARHHWLSCLYVILFVIYSYYHSVSILTQITVNVVIFQSVNESMIMPRYSMLRYSIYDIIRLLSQLLGDILTLPYSLMIQQYENPFIYFQNTNANINIINKISSVITQYHPTFYLRNSLIQFAVICLNETPLIWYFIKHKYHIKRECIQTNDHGLIALDWWCKPKNLKYFDDSEHFKFCQYVDKINIISYSSRVYYKFTKTLYDKCFMDTSEYPDAESTNILLVFPTFAGDSLSSPVRLICDYFVQRNWRVIVYCKRGCGSFTKFEFLPLTTLKPFCLKGEQDYDIIINIIQNRYPTANKMLLGLSGGGSYVQSILSNKKYANLFCGGIKIDSGTHLYKEANDLDKRHPIISYYLAQFHEVEMIKCRNSKIKYNTLEKDQYYNKFEWNKILNEKNDRLKILGWSLKYLVCPSYGFKDKDEYLKWCQFGDLKHISKPFLILDTLNDFMRNAKDIKQTSKENKNIIHVINRFGTHCIRREGIIDTKCWLSKVSFSFAEAVINNLHGKKVTELKT